MLKIQHGLAGFFIGAFVGFLIGLIEMRLVGNRPDAPTILFFLIGLTVLFCAILGMIKGLQIARKKIIDQ